jgi:hypothetical protein
VTHGHILAWKKNFRIVFRGASLTGGRGCHVQGSKSVSLLCVCSYACVEVDPVLILSYYVLGDINTGAWPSGMGVGRGTNNLTL